MVTLGLHCPGHKPFHSLVQPLGTVRKGFHQMHEAPLGEEETSLSLGKQDEYSSAPLRLLRK